MLELTRLASEGNPVSWKRKERIGPKRQKTRTAVEHARACKEDLLKQRPRWAVKDLNAEAAHIAAKNLRQWDPYYGKVKNLEKQLEKELSQNRL